MHRPYAVAREEADESSCKAVALCTDVEIGEREGAIVGYIMGLTRIIFNKSNKILWFVALSVVWFNTVSVFD